MKNKPVLITLVATLVIGTTGNLLGETNLEKTQVNGLLQFWYQNDNSATPKDTFRLRRAEIKLSGMINPVISWSIMVDPAQIIEDDIKTKTIAGEKAVTSVGRKSPLQDFSIKFNFPKWLFVNLGQFKPPVNMEALTSSSKLLLAERALMSTTLKWGEQRDIGVTLSHDNKIKSIKTHLSIGFFNGAGLNRLDDNEAIDIACRFTAGYKALHLGTAHYNGKTGKDEKVKCFSTVEVKYEKEPFYADFEYATGKDKDKNQYTYYTTLGYSFLKKFQVVGRYNYYDCDIDNTNDAITETTIGINYFIEKHNAKIQFNYVMRGEEKTSIDNDAIRLNIQLSY